MKIRAISTLCTLLLAPLAWSQSQPASSDAQSSDPVKAEVFGGFSMAAGGLLGTGLGYNAGGDFRLAHRIFLAAEFDQFRDPAQPSNKMSDYLFLAGPRYLFPLQRSSRSSFFGEVLFGGNTFHNSGQAYTYSYNNATNYALAADAGVDVGLARHFALRFEGGYLYSKLAYSTYGGPVSPSTTGNNRARFAIDAVYRF